MLIAPRATASVAGWLAAWVRGALSVPDLIEGSDWRADASGQMEMNEFAVQPMCSVFPGKQTE